MGHGFHWWLQPFRGQCHHCAQNAAIPPALNLEGPLGRGSVLDVQMSHVGWQGVNLTFEPLWLWLELV